MTFEREMHHVKRGEGLYLEMPTESEWGASVCLRRRGSPAEIAFSKPLRVRRSPGRVIVDLRAHELDALRDSAGNPARMTLALEVWRAREKGMRYIETTHTLILEA